MLRHELQVRRVRILAVILAMFFVGAQFHYCTDLAPGSSSHNCPLCAASSSVIAPPPLTLTVQPLTSDLEVLILVPDTSVDVFSATSPRAPPSSLLS